ncbi:glycyl radical protein [Candidatus Aminicenantes bacterium AC-335-B20]|jgi:formate C-acetyltransferase|nr:glycyl radical protein [SCandidatus Aminicenantes bacterium Aminicenantia_JdfR_composite]MCP2596451.1 glycyl radical protein [Candidatus Aminicenantes bacterium AC-335-G13]MCP2598844.1 glycyl radical protein [Candidatus Aminicenantes bacterium AC-335-B20]MCP2620915.1 glycyl radical protein [Candidatus Aminicenantes bacterium AC-334-E05]
MNERIAKLREQSINTKPYITPERAILITKFYKSDVADRVSLPVKRALAFKYILENKEICINNGELIVGERGPAPKATPTYPEICCHSIEDLEILNSRKKIPYKVDEFTFEVYKKEIIPFWKGKSIRDKIFEEMLPEWKLAYEAGIFTEFMEQRAPGHTVLDNKIYKKGFLDFKKEIRKSMEKLDFLNDPEAYDKLEELRAMEIAVDALIIYAKRHAEKLKELSKQEKNPERRKELERMVEICSRIPAYPPRDFWEALQYYWFVHLGVIIELNGWDSFNPGRLDQHLYPFYKKGLEERTLTVEKAKELLEAFWIKFNNQPAPPKVGVTGEESSTYTDFALINLGGVKEDGSDAVNELSYLILDVIKEMKLVQPSSMVQISKKNPDSFLKKALEVVRIGFGQPSIFNTDAIIQELLRQGKSIEDARNGGASGCVEAGAFGKESYILTGYLNFPKIFEITLNNGLDPRTGKKVGLETGDPVSFKTFDELFEAFQKQMKYFIDIKIRGNNIIERLYAEYVPAPFLSVLIDDCILKGKDYHNGGARYNTSYIQGVGLGTITDSLTAIKYHVYDKKNITMEEMLKALKNNFRGYEKFRLILLNKTPKYGNDDDYADYIMKNVFDVFFNAVDGRPNTRGGTHRINLLPTTVHIYFGKVTGATPDGREAQEPLSEGVSPVQGADRKGPTAVIKSVAKIDHVKTGGTLLNQKFTPSILQDDEGLDKLAKLIRTYFKLDGHHVQFNVVTAETLRDAQKHPEKYRDLIVRVAGYSDYFVDLKTELQNEIIKRTEHKSI